MLGSVEHNINTFVNMKVYWWNTGVKPPISGRSGPRTLGSAELAIQAMIAKQADLIFLCEVDESFCIKLSSNPILIANGYKICDLVNRVGKIVWDYGCIYSNKFKNIEREFLENTNAEESHKKLGVKVKLTNLQDDDFWFYLIHWPSPRNSSFSDNSRVSIACKTFDLIKTNIKQENELNTVVLGDFNESFVHPSIMPVSQNTFSRALSLDCNYLYNPFWRCMGEKYSNNQKPIHSHLSGTYNWNNRWYFFDYAFVSKYFLSEDHNWRIDDDKSEVDESVLASASDFIDHIPISLTFERR